MSDENSNIKIVNVEIITNEVLTETEIYTMTINRLAKITQFNIANHTFSDSHTSDLSHYVWFYVDQFSEELAVKTSIESNAEHVIDLEKEKQSSFRLIYNQFTKKLKALWEYIQKVLDKDWIQKSKSLTDASVLFISKKDDELHLCVNYRDINNITIKNKYSLFLFSDIFDYLSNSVIYIKLDLHNVYY